MCSYKVVKVFFEVWGLQGRVESAVHRVSCYVFKDSLKYNIAGYCYAQRYSRTDNGWVMFPRYRYAKHKTID